MQTTWGRGAAVVAAGALLAASAGAQQIDRQARAWASACAPCHGTDGVPQTDAVPALAGRKAEDLLKALGEFRAGQRPAATVMHQHAKGYTDDELRRIAQWFASQPGAK